MNYEFMIVFVIKVKRPQMSKISINVQLIQIGFHHPLKNKPPRSSHSSAHHAPNAIDTCQFDAHGHGGQIQIFNSDRVEPFDFWCRCLLRSTALILRYITGTQKQLGKTLHRSSTSLISSKVDILFLLYWHYADQIQDLGFFIKPPIIKQWVGKIHLKMWRTQSHCS